jgi:hypothetical protein
MIYSCLYYKVSPQCDYICPIANPRTSLSLDRNAVDCTPQLHRKNKGIFSCLFNKYMAVKGYL